MKPLGARQIAGNWAALLLPINGDDSIDFARMSDEIDTLIEAKVSGIYSNGSAGEFYTQTEAEFDRINEVLASRCERAAMPFQIGASHSSPQITLERIKRAISLSPGALQVILPDWLPLTNEEAVAYLTRLAEAAAPIGLVLYNPPHAKRRLSPLELGRLYQRVPLLVGVKVGGGDANWYAAMREHMQGLSVFIPGGQLASGLREGAHGSYSNVACLHPAGAQHWYMLARQDMTAALALETRIQAFLTQYISPLVREQGYTGGAADKLLCAIGGWADVGTRLRWPYRSIPDALVDHLRPATRQRLPELF